MTDVTLPLTNTAYGYPSRGNERRMAPRRLACIHVTANPNTPPATARQERDYANRANSGGPSAHSYLGRDGYYVHAIDPVKYAAWSNGVLRSPKVGVPGVAEVVALKAAGANPNEDYFREIETCGRYPDFPITVEERDALARQIAQDSLTTNLPIARETVHLHSDLDTEMRPNCPVPAAGAEAFVSEVIRAAREWRYRMQIDALAEQLSVANAHIEALNGLIDSAAGTISTVQTERDEALAQRDEAVQWGKRLQGFGGAILATDAPEWVE